jgi:hypothetical protein
LRPSLVNTPRQRRPGKYAGCARLRTNNAFAASTPTGSLSHWKNPPNAQIKFALPETVEVLTAAGLPFSELPTTQPRD